MGGQDLRGGDPREATSPSRLNCCIACLEKGVRGSESLFHVTFECPAYTDLRQARVINDITQNRDFKTFCLHRDVWSWRQLKVIRHFFVQLCDRRSSLMGGRGYNAAQNAQFRADQMWDRFHA